MQFLYELNGKYNSIGIRGLTHLAPFNLPVFSLLTCKYFTNNKQYSTNSLNKPKNIFILDIRKCGSHHPTMVP